MPVRLLTSRYSMSNTQPPVEVRRLMRTFDPFNYPSIPSMSSPQVINSIESAQRDIQDYDAQISDIFAILHSVEKKKAWTHRYAEACQSFTASSPFRELPTEIVSQILTDVLHTAIIVDLYYPRNLELHSRVYYLSISRVCSRWRSIVQSMPSESRVSRIDIYDDRNNIDDAMFETLCDLFKMSGESSTLSVEIITGNNRDDFSESRLPHFLDIHFWRIRNFITNNGSLLHEISDGPFPSLQSLTLCNRSVSEPDEIHLESIAPNLQSLELTGDQGWLNINWAKLTSIRFNHSSAAFIVGILKLCHSLESLHMHRCESREYSPGIVEEVHTLPNLHTFCAKGNTDTCMLYIQLRIPMPSLTQFDLDACYYPLPPVPLLMARSANSLTTLKLVNTIGHHHSISSLETLFTVFHLLEVLILEIRKVPDHEGSNADYPNWLINLFRSPTLSCLEKLELQLRLHGADESVIVSMIESRWGVDEESRKFKSVMFSIHDFESESSTVFSEESWERLGAMQKDGLLIHVEDDLGDVRARMESRHKE